MNFWGKIKCYFHGHKWMITNIVYLAGLDGNYAIYHGNCAVCSEIKKDYLKHFQESGNVDFDKNFARDTLHD